MSPVSLSSLIPNADDLLALDVEEVAGVLLAYLNNCGQSSGNSVVQHGYISDHNFFNTLDQYPEYPGRQPEVNQALMEAWGWLVSEGFLVRQPSQTGWFFLSRRAQRLKSRADFAEYRKANLLPKAHLHLLIATKVYPAFPRGEYDTAVFQAFREVEVAVRTAGGFPSELVGRELMREAFRPANPNKPAIAPGPLADTAGCPTFRLLKDGIPRPYPCWDFAKLKCLGRCRHADRSVRATRTIAAAAAQELHGVVVECRAAHRNTGCPTFHAFRKMGFHGFVPLG
jgi:Protein of unknown function (Hypoth_ymh)